MIGALAGNVAHALLARDQGRAAGLAAAAAALVVLSFAIFFIWTYPVNVATVNWTVAPQNWDALRTQWEYSHAANAFVLFAALCCAVVAALPPRR